jgi:hypothetical protein
VGRTFTPLTRGSLPSIAAGTSLAVVAAVVAGLLVTRDDPDASGYQVTYSVEDLTTHTRSTEVVEVDGPLRSRRLAGRTGSATSERGVFDRRDGRWRQVAVTPPGEVGQALRLTAALDWAADRGLAAQDGTSSIAGRNCTWWLTKEPLDTAPVAAASTADRTRSCVDDQGRLLADEWRSGDRDLRRRTATRIRSVDLDVFDGTKPEPVPTNLVVTAVQVLPEAANDLVALTPPKGLDLVTAAQYSELVPGTTDVQRRAVRAVYADGSDLLVVDQVRGPLDAPGRRVEVPGLGTGGMQATGGGLVLTIPLAPDQHLRVRTSLSYDALLAWLATVTRR